MVEDGQRKRCKVCAYDHHKKLTAEQRRIRTTLIYGWDAPHACVDCGGPYVDDRRYRTGVARTRCPECWAKKNGPRPDRQCLVCQMSIPARNRVCDGCRPEFLLSNRRKYSTTQREKNKKPPVICNVCGNTSLNRKSVCGPCGSAVRRREAGRLRSFRERLFTSLVFTSVEVEHLIQLLDSPCMYCGSTENITIEHILPLIRGGQHTMDNVGPACRSCNSSKQSQTPEEFQNSISQRD